MAMNDTAHAGGEIFPQTFTYLSYNQKNVIYTEQNAACMGEAQYLLSGSGSFSGGTFESLDYCFLAPPSTSSSRALLLRFYVTDTYGQPHVLRGTFIAAIAKVMCPAHSISSPALNDSCICDLNYVPDIPGPSATSCVPDATCPSNSTRSDLYPFQCTCNTGYRFDAVGGICVPLRECPVPGLTPLTDPVAIGFENGNRWRPDLLTSGASGYQTKLACVQNGIIARGGTSVGTSAYRPTQYQQHLFEIIKKDVKLNADYMTAHPGCQSLRDEITRDMGSQKGPPPGHALKYKQRVAIPGTSRHESGTAFDVTPSRLTDAQLAPVYSGCGVTHTAVPGEPWHVQ